MTGKGHVHTYSIESLGDRSYMEACVQESRVHCPGAISFYILFISTQQEVCLCFSGKFLQTYCLFGVKKSFIFQLLLFLSREVFFLKGMGDRFLLSKDERLTPDIDKVINV